MLQKLGLGVLAALVVAFIAMNALAWSGALIEEEDMAPPQTSRVEPSAPPPGEPIARKHPSKPLEKAKTGGTTLTLVATRGDCWVEVRAGSPTGPSLYSGTLASGDTLRFNRPRLWLRLGAASNVDNMVNGRPTTDPFGTVEYTVPDA